MKNTFRLGLLALSLLSGTAYAQVLPIPIVPQVGANDLFQDVVGGMPSAQSAYATAGQINNVVSVVQTVPLTAFTITQAQGVTWTAINPAGTLATGTFTFEPIAVNGSRACFVSSQTQTAVTFTANTGQSVSGNPTSMVAGTAVCFTYIAASSTWFKM